MNRQLLSHFRNSRQFAAITVLSISALLEIATARADEGLLAPQAAQEQTYPAPLLEEPVEVPLDVKTDQTHQYLEKSILEQIVRLDNFFGSGKTDTMKKTRYALRWRTSLLLNEDGRLKPSTTFRANIHLSRMNERLRLSIAGEDIADTNMQSLPEDPGSPGLDRTSQPARLVNTELRYTLKETENLNSFLGAGIRFNFPMKTFIRGRLLYNYPLSDVTLLRMGETLFLRSGDGFGETTEVSLERLLDKKTVLRWANSGTVAESINGLEWGSELSLIQELSAKRAVYVTGGIYGNSNSSALITNYLIKTNYRINFWRHWLYYEIEPEISWPRNVHGSYIANFAVTLRLEVMFAGTDASSGK